MGCELSLAEIELRSMQSAQSVYRIPGAAYQALRLDGHRTVGTGIKSENPLEFTLESGFR